VTATREEGEPAHDVLVFEVRHAPLKPTFDFDHWNKFKDRQ
jgi:hypothetical protein